MRSEVFIGLIALDSVLHRDELHRDERRPYLYTDWIGRHPNGEAYRMMGDGLIERIDREIEQQQGVVLDGKTGSIQVQCKHKSATCQCHIYFINMSVF